MLYSIQNAGGEVYGIFQMPETTQSAEVWAAELDKELDDILGYNRARDSRLVMRDGSKEDRIVIDIEPIDTERDLARVHETIGRLATRDE